MTDDEPQSRFSRRGRRGEVPFVAVRVGRSNDPRECEGLARELRVSRATALGILTLWEEFVLEVGDAITGRVKGYSADHIAAKCCYDGPSKKLIAALMNAGVLSQHRTTFFHAYWTTSITGQYAIDRAEQRETWRLKKQRQRENEKGDVSGTTGGRPGDNGVMSQGTADIDKEINDVGGSARPPPPPAGGGGVGATRWNWMLDNHPRAENSRTCVPLLARMDADTWALVQWVVVEARPGGALSSSRKKRALSADSARFLRNELYLQFRRERVKKLEAKNAPKNGANVEAPTDKLTSSIAFILEYLADPDLSEAQKDKARANWRKQNPDVPPPWEKASAGPGAHGESSRPH